MEHRISNNAHALLPFTTFTTQFVKFVLRLSLETERSDGANTVNTMYA